MTDPSPARSNASADTDPLALDRNEIEGPRAATQYELPGALDLANLVLRTLGSAPGAPPRRPSIGRDYPHVFHAGNAENVRVCLHRGRVVCAVGIYPSTVHTPAGSVTVGGINALVTQPEYRGLGLATLIMEDASAHMRDTGMQIGQLSTRIQDFYRKLGWESAGRQRTFTIDRGNCMLLPAPPAAVSDRWQDQVEALVALHRAAPYHTERSASSLRLLFERKVDQVLLDLGGGHPVAYVALRGASVVEHAGPVDAVTALLAAAFAAIDDPGASTSRRVPGTRATPEMTVITPEPSPVGDWLLACGVPNALSYQGMLRVIDAPGLAAGLGCDALQLTDRPDGRWLATAGGSSATLDARQLIRLLVGPERCTELAVADLPAPYFLWPPDRV